MTLTHPVIASMRDERDVEVPTIPIPAMDTWVVEDGDDYPAEAVHSFPVNCYCADGRCRYADFERTEYENDRIPDGAHRRIAHIFAVTTEVKPA